MIRGMIFLRKLWHEEVSCVKDVSCESWGKNTGREVNLCDTVHRGYFIWMSCGVLQSEAQILVCRVY